MITHNQEKFIAQRRFSPTQFISRRSIFTLSGSVTTAEDKRHSLCPVTHSGMMGGSICVTAVGIGTLQYPTEILSALLQAMMTDRPSAGSTRAP